MPSTAEVAWALILALYKRVAIEDRALREGRWQLDLPRNLAGDTLGLVGSRTARRVHGRPGPRIRDGGDRLEPEPHRRARERGGRARVGKSELLERADVLSIHLVLSDRTRGLIGAAELALMKATAFLVNTSRGPIVEERALIEALRRARSPAPGSTSTTASRCPPGTT